MSTDEEKRPNGKSFWPHPEIYEKTRIVQNPTPRLSILKFGSLRDALGMVGKLLVQNIVYYIIFFMVGLPLFFGPTELGGDQFFLAFTEIVRLSCYTISVAFVVKVFNDSQIADLGLKLNRRAFHDFLAGLAIVLIVLSMYFLLSLGAGWIVIQNFVWQRMSLAGILGNILITFVIFCFVGWNEELLSRGFHLRVMSKGLNLPLGVILSSLYFSYLHRHNPGASFDYLLFVFVAALMFSYAFLRTGQLWLAIGLHAGYDFFSVVIFSNGGLGALKIFGLMDIGYRISRVQYIASEFFLLAVITILIYLYTKNRKPEPLEW